MRASSVRAARPVSARRLVASVAAPLLALAGFFSCLAQTPAAEPPPARRCVLIELYVRSDQDASQTARTAAESFAAERSGVQLVVRDVADDAGRERMKRITDYFRLPPESTPLIYGCNTVVQGEYEATEYANRLRQMTLVEVFVRSGCQHCEDAKSFLSRVMPSYPGLQIAYRDILASVANRQAMSRLAQQYRQAAASTPVFHFCGQLVVGYDRDTSTGARVLKALDRWTIECAASPPPAKPVADASAAAWSLASLAAVVSWTQEQAEPPLLPLGQEPQLPIGDGPLPLGDDGPQLPLGPALEEEGAPPSLSPLGDEDEMIDLPWIGAVNVSELGLPLFTIAVGLIDGFNPCAMWVLLFLLSILVNLHSRTRILMVAGVFVLVSGAAYFAFMAAWLNVFLLVGFLRPIQITLGLLALTVGGIHIKDFFAFKRGVSLSIPDSAKPGIYQRVRAIATAEHLTGALLGATVLAVMVNVVELLCTAGLPALYTQVLTMQQLPPWQNYAYLFLYNVAYMFDDGLMVTLVAVTLGKRKLQENEGRWLKLISGTVVAALGLVMLFRPELLY